MAGMQAELSALQPQLVHTVAEVMALMAQIAGNKRDVVEPMAAVLSSVLSSRGSSSCRRYFYRPLSTVYSLGAIQALCGAALEVPDAAHVRIQA